KEVLELLVAMARSRTGQIPAGLAWVVFGKVFMSLVLSGVAAGVAAGATDACRMGNRSRKTKKAAGLVNPAASEEVI
ncbi:MAG: TRAP-type C4-dicarboxylate transport system permease large subunit, partial [Ilumatobacter sp.]